MIGDLGWFCKKIRNKFPKKRIIKVFKPYIFNYEEVNTFSDLKKCKLTIIDNSFCIDGNETFDFKDVLNIELIKTIIKISNKGRVIKITLKANRIICFSFGQPEMLSHLYSLNLSNSDNLFCLFCEKWNQSKKTRKTE